MPSPDAPLAGSCACGTVRFEITSEFTTAGYCHCHRCQRRSGAPWSMNGVIDASAVRVLSGADTVAYWRPEGGMPKGFCTQCGGHVWSGEPSGATMAVRFGTLEADPGIAPQWRQWVSSSQEWHLIPDDGVPRYPEKRP